MRRRGVRHVSLWCCAFQRLRTSIIAHGITLLSSVQLDLCYHTFCRIFAIRPEYLITTSLVKWERLASEPCIKNWEMIMRKCLDFVDESRRSIGPTFYP